MYLLKSVPSVSVSLSLIANYNLNNMKKVNLILLALVVICISISCKKNSGGGTQVAQDTQVEYRIEPANSFVYQISFNDKTGSAVTLTDYSQFSGGVKTIAVASKPFVAKLQVKVNNTTLFPVSYTLSILVDGQLRNFYQFTSQAMIASTTGEVEYIVQ